MNQRRAARIGQQLAAQADQSARGNLKFHAHAARAVVDHLSEFAAPRAEAFHDDSDVGFRAVHHQHFQRFEALAVFGFHHDFRLADHQLVAFAAHGFDQDGQLQFAAAQHAKGFGRVGMFHADGDVGEQFFCQAVANIARGQPLAFAARPAAS